MPPRTPDRTLKLTLSLGLLAMADSRPSSPASVFYASVANNLERIAVPGLGTFGVTQRGGRYVLLYDPKKIEEYSLEEFEATLEHEILHIILAHIPRSMSCARACADRDERIIFRIVDNIALDMADNELLRQSRPAIADPAQPLGYWVLAAQQNPPMPPNKTYEEYLYLLTEKVKSELKVSPLEILRRALGIYQQTQSADAVAAAAQALTPPLAQAPSQENAE